MEFKCGFFVVITPDRIDDLRKMIISLKQHNKQPVQIMIVDNVFDLWRCKILAPELSKFGFTVSLDTDIYINGNLSHLFDVAEGGNIGVHFEEIAQVYNTGIIAYPEMPCMGLGKEWLELYEQCLRGYDTSRNVCDYNHTDQPHFNEIAHKYPIEKLPEEYNYLCRDHTPDHEAKNFNKIKIFHFLHGGMDYSDKSPYRSYQAYINL